MHIILISKFVFKLFIFRPAYCVESKAKASRYKCQKCKEKFLDSAVRFYCLECLDDDFDFGIHICQKCEESEPHIHEVKKHSPSNPSCAW